MRISDWSSDVCSSDLSGAPREGGPDGYYKESATGYKQYDMRLNLDAKINDYISTKLSITAREEFRHFPTVGAGAIFRIDRKSVVEGKSVSVSVDHGGRRIIKTQQKEIRKIIQQ